MSTSRGEQEQFVSYAQHGEDVILWRALGSRSDVFYVDVGAFHPTDDSVTRALYERGWRGVNIEAQPDRLQAFLDERPEDVNLSCAVGDHDGAITLTLPGNPGWATTLDPVVVGAPEGARSIEVPVRTLTSLLAEQGIDEVDVLKIDVEGAEPAVVRGLLDGPVRPVVCVVEGVAPGVGRAAGDEAVALLVAAGYRHCLFDGLNHYLTTDERLEPALSVPANPIDAYLRDLEQRLLVERRQLHEVVASLVAENLALKEAARGPSPEEDLGLPAEEEPVLPDEEEHARPEALDPTTTWTRTPVLRTLDPAERERRRRAAFRSVLHGAPAPRSEQSAPLTSVPSILDATPADRTSRQVVGILFRGILRRDVGYDEAEPWVKALDGGVDPFDLAAEIARSEEAGFHPLEHRRRVGRDLESWRLRRVARQLGLESRQLSRITADASAADQCFVTALFLAALQRPPTPAELEHEVVKLRDGVGREWMLRAFANRVEVRDRYDGSGGTGLRGQIQRVRRRGRRTELFRDAVLAHEVLIVARLQAALDDDQARLHAAIPDSMALEKGD